MLPRKPAILAVTLVLATMTFGQFAIAAQPNEPRPGQSVTNANFLDGLDSTEFSLAGHDHDDLYLSLDGLGALPLDADTLDGLDSTAFSLVGHEHDEQYLPLDGKAVDADALDGLDGDRFVRYAPNGNVGIGTSEPVEKLQVNGEVSIRGAANALFSAVHDGSADGRAGYGAVSPSGAGGFSLQTARGASKHLAGTPDDDTELSVRGDFHIGRSEPYVTVRGSDGNVGIGTTSPTAKLHVKSGDRATINLDSGGSNSLADMNFLENGASRAAIVKIPSTDSQNPNLLAFYSDGRALPGNPSGIAFLTSTPTAFREAMRITSEGRVGIGTSTPHQDEMLHIKDDRAGMLARIALDSTGDSKGIDFWENGVQQGFVTMVATNDATKPNVLNIGVDGRWNPGNHAGISFYVNNDYPEGDSREAIRISKDADVGIGTATPQSALEVNGYVQLARVAGAPPAADCDAGNERGRMTVDAAAGLLYVCMDSGWVGK